MAGRGRPGGEPLVEQRELFVSLIAAGVSNSAACRQVGVNRKTGTRWRYGRSIPAAGGGLLHYPPVLNPATTTISSRYLSAEERVTIADLHRAGHSSRAIAEQVRRSPSTISRELARNTGSDGRYGAGAAQRFAASRRRRPRARRLELDPVLRSFVQQCMDVRWSPEQISHALTVEFGDEPGRQLVPESLYQALYATNPVLRRTFRTRRWRRRRRPHRHPDARSGYRLATPMTMIDRRPAAAADRVQVGHWEGDLIMGPANGSAIATLVERSTRTLMLVHLPHGRTAAATRDALAEVFTDLPAGLRRSLTWDQGKELSAHAELARTTDMPVFFCQPHSPWQRGSNENINGLIRQYLPKGTDLSVYSQEQLDAIAYELNIRPRKRFNWKCPIEVMTEVMEKAMAMQHDAPASIQ